MRGPGGRPLPQIPTRPFLKRYTFYPQGGTLYRDILTGNFVDLDPAVGSVNNYLCAPYGNDGHRGCDSAGYTWEEMALGVPVYAALDGVVVDARDGDPDMNTSCLSGGNWVAIDHGAGRIAWYLHFKTGSVSVSLGQPVSAGQQIGLVGSSGCSYAPHLHFESWQNGRVYEPFRGPCLPGIRGWQKQIDPPASGAFVRNMGVTIQDIGAAPPLPNRAPVDNQVPLSAGGEFQYWIQLGNLPANSTWLERYVRPNGATEFELGPFPFNNPFDYQESQWWFHRLVTDMGTVTGTWRIQFEVNGVLLVDAPVEVVSTVSPTFNRPPADFGAMLEPAVLKSNRVAFARVNAPALGTGYRDADWDLVRYRYEWTVNGSPVRDITSSGMADALDHSLYSAGDLVAVTITAGDGFGGGLGATATPVVLSTTVQ